MSSDSPKAIKLSRLLNLVAALQANITPLTAEEIRKRVPGYGDDGGESFRRMFERDKDELREIGIPIETVQVRHLEQPIAGYTIRKEDYELRDPGLTPEELTALHVAATSVQLEGFDEVGAFRKLGGRGADRGAGELGSVPLPAPAADLFKGVTDRRRATFGYHGTERRVDPWRLEYARGRWYLTGFDVDRDDRRTFRVDRIEGPVRTGDPGTFEVPADVGRINFGAWAYGDEPTMHARVLLDADIAAATVADAPSLRVLEERDDGSVVVGMDISNAGAALGFLVALLDRAEVLEPPQLRRQVVEWLEAFRSGTADGRRAELGAEGRAS